MLKRLIILAEKLDELGYRTIVDEIDSFINQFTSKVNKKDLLHAIEFYNNTQFDEIDPSSLTLDNIVMMKPEAFMPTLNTSEKGWLRKYPIKQWAKLLTEKEGAQQGRNFTHIINMYKSGNINPAIQINGSFGDGSARAAFFDAIDEYMPVAQFSATAKETN